MSILGELKRRNVIRVGIAYLAAAWLLLQVADTVLPALGLPGWLMPALIYVAALAFPLALLLAWLYEWTPEGVLTSAVAEDAPRASKVSKRRFDLVVIGVMGLAIAFLVLDSYLLPGLSSGVNRASIAVLAFDDLSAERDQEYFADGIAEELLHLLQRIPELHVAGRTSSFSFKGKNLPIPEIGKALNVAHVLEGSVRTDGDRIRITAQLIDAENDRHLWSATYDEIAGEVFAVQDAIAARIVAALKVTLLDAPPSVDVTRPEIYRTYLEAVHINRNMIVESLPRARRLLEQAIEDDPSYLPARIELGITLQALANRGLLDQAELRELTRRNINQQAAIWPDRPEVDLGRGWVALSFDQDLETAARYYERAFAKLRRYDAGAQRLALNLNRPDVAIALAEYALKRDPICFYCYANLIEAYLRARRYDDVLAACETARALGFEDLGFQLRHAEALLYSGDAAGALREFESLDWPAAAVNLKLYWLAASYWSLGQSERFESTFAELRARAADLAVAALYAFIGEPNEAAEILLAQEKLPLGFFDDTMGDAMRQHPDWPLLAAKAGIFPEDPREHIRFEVNLPE